MVLKNRSSYSYDSRNRLSLADEIGRYAADAREMGKAATYASHDTTGERAMSHVALDAEIRMDQGAASVGVDLGASYEVATITATPLSSTHRVEERNVAVYVSTYSSDYAEVDDWSFATLEDGSLYIRLAEPVKARYVKLHCRYDERDADGSVHDVSTFGNAARSIVTVGYHETSRRESYDYDDQGNRLYVETRLGSRTDSFAYSYYAGSDRIRTSGDRAYVYDQNGNMTKRGTSYAFDGDEPIYEHDGYYRSYGYDLQNRLVKVSGYIDGVLTTLATYGYSGDNLRLTKTAGGETTRYVHGIDGNELYRATGTDSVSTVWFFGRKLVEIEVTAGSEKRSYLHTDHLGSVVAATDEAGATIWLGDNSAFGVATADAGLASRTASYTGKDYDEEAGLYYFNARWYDAELGRFTTEDPVRDDVNWYVYCANRPMTLTDPDGRQASSLISPSGTTMYPVPPNNVPPSNHPAGRQVLEAYDTADKMADHMQWCGVTINSGIGALIDKVFLGSRLAAEATQLYVEIITTQTEILSDVISSGFFDFNDDGEYSREEAGSIADFVNNSIDISYPDKSRNVGPYFVENKDLSVDDVFGDLYPQDQVDLRSASLLDQEVK